MRGIVVNALSALLGFAVVFLFPLMVWAQEAPAPTTYEPLLAGMEHYRAGQYEQALVAFQKAADLLPQDPDVPFFLGLTLLQLNRPDQAIVTFRRAVELDPTHLDARFQLGLALVQQQTYPEAIPQLEAVAKEEPDREDLGYFLGLAYYQTGQYQKSLATMERARTKDKTIEGLTLYYTALARQQLGQTKEAASIYRQVISRDPTSPLAGPSQQLLETIALEEEQPKKRFNLELTAKLQYDDNVILVPTTNVFSLRDKDRESLANVFFLRGEYFLLRRPTVDLSASYGFFQTLYYHVDKSDVQDHIFGLDLSSRLTLGVPINLRLNYSYDYLFLDSDAFLQRHTVRPNALIQWRPWFLTLLQYTIQIKDFRAKPIFSEDNRDAENHEVGLVQFLTFGEGRHYLKAGYFYEREGAEGSNWDYRANRFLGGLQYTFPWEVRFTADYEYRPVRYGHTNIFFEDEGKRRDIDRALVVALSKEVLKNLTISLEYLNRRNSSNIALFDPESGVKHQ